MNSDNLSKVLENSIRMGLPMVIEDMDESLEAVLEPLLLGQIIQTNRRKMVRVGDSDVQYDDKFELFITTKSTNPNFLPDIFIRVTVINFTVTQLGLEEQLLGEVVSKQMPEIESIKNELIVSIAGGKSNLKKNEDKLLDLLTNSKGMILDDVELIENLKLSKQTSMIVKENILQAETKQVEIDQARSKYQVVAERGSTLYFVISDLSIIDPMYKFSLSYFIQLFLKVIATSPQNQDRDERIQILVDNITSFSFDNICRGLFNDHKRIFSFLVSSAIALKNGQIKQNEWTVFNRGVALPKEKAPPVPSNVKLNEKIWIDAFNLREANPVFNDLTQKMSENWQEWDAWINSPEPFTKELPGSFEQAVSVFQRLLLVQTFREQKTLYTLAYYVGATLGQKYVTFNVATMEEVYADTDYQNPLIFILSPGADPLSNLLRFARDMQIAEDKFVKISLGQGQGVFAERAIDAGIKTGGWVVLQNCHLGKSFMPTLEQKLDGFDDPKLEVNTQFRLFLTSMPCDYFPVSVLQNGLQLTNEPPKGLKANVSKSFGELTEDRFENCAQSEAFKKLIFSLSIFHAVVQERRKFGPLGWNIRYQFNDSDLSTASTILFNMLNKDGDIPWEALRYVIGEIVYGGRVTDDWDRRTLISVLSNYVVENVINTGYKFSESGIYSTPGNESLERYREIVTKFPEFEQPEVFGMHDNANITFQLKESKQALETILNLQPRDSSGGGGEGEAVVQTTDQIIEEMCIAFEEKLPLILKAEATGDGGGKQRKSIKQDSKMNLNDSGPIDSLQICLLQECERFNKLLFKIKGSLNDMKKAIQGQIVMSAQLDQMYSSFLNNQVPENWKGNISYPSLRPLSSWFEDLVARTDFFRQWLLSEAQPQAYWISAFFFPQGFLTSVLQNYARQNQIAIDELNFAYKFTNNFDPENQLAGSDSGAFIYGLYMEGCSFDSQNLCIDENPPGVMFSLSPLIEFIPTLEYAFKQDDYKMPVYKTSLRAGTLSTTGHSTNFIIAIDIPTNQQKPLHWILRGAAFICQLNN